MSKLEEIRARHSLISPWPWQADPATGGENCGLIYSAEGEDVARIFGNGWCEDRQEEYGEADQAFVVSAAQDVAYLLKLLDDALAENKKHLKTIKAHERRLGWEYD